MKKLLNLSFLSILCACLFFVTSCKDDDPVIDPGSDGINVADGLYLTLAGQEPGSSTGLVAEVVEAEGFQSQARTGFTGNYMYLDAGDYNVVNIAAKEITQTIGGTAADVTDDGSLCMHNTYNVITTAEGGPAFSVPSNGFYKVTHDAMTNELIMYQITEASAIGSATDNGWSADTPLDATITSEGATFTGTGITLRSGEWKIRFNCRWGINRRAPDPNATLDDPANGYQLFTNFGGATNALETGGANIQQTEDGVYTITASWTPQDGWALATEKTGDAPVITFNPNDYRMAVIGDATANGWDGDRNLFHKEDMGVHTWYGVVTFAGAGEYKFRANDEWNFDLGNDINALEQGGGNLPTPGAGAHYIVLSTADEGASWTGSVSPIGWSIIGAGGPNADWATDVPMNADGFTGGGGAAAITTYSVTGDFTTDPWKFRAGGDWAHNLGDNLNFLVTDGSDIVLNAAGNYTVTLSFDGEVYSASVQ